MEKAKNVKEFVERMDAQKKKNPKDLSSDQDLTIGIMNLISIEEHLIFSGAKTGKTSFYDMVYEIREMRKNLMLKVIPSYEGEVWCISKHLLSASMRLLEVGTKQLGMGRKEEAYKLFDQSYDLYCMFWGLNMNLIDTKDVKWINNDEEKVKEITAQLDEAKTEITAEVMPEPAKETVLVGKEETAETGGSFFGKMKSVIRKAVDCCIE
jgi:hypothetical protein